MTKNIVLLFTLTLIFIASGCKNSTPDAQVQKDDPTQKNKPDLVFYSNTSANDFEHTFNTECPNNGGYLVCTLETDIGSSPIKGINGTQICITPDNEYKLVMSAWFAYEGGLDGIGCRISRKSYDDIKDYYGYLNEITKYMDHKDLSNFETWKTRSGYITLYREIRGIQTNDGDNYNYYLYAGPSENPQYSNRP